MFEEIYLFALARWFARAQIPNQKHVLGFHPPFPIIDEQVCRNALSWLVILRFREAKSNSTYHKS